jgi:triphosphatase
MLKPETGKEIELKLGVAATDLDRLRQTEPLRSVRPGRRRMADVYYDTPDRRLLSRGLTLRLRQAGKRFEQTLKHGDAGSAAQTRGEWNARLPTPVIDLAAFKTNEPRDALDGVDVTALRPVFSTAIAREKRILSVLGQGGAVSRVELCIDIGEIIADGRQSPVSELELELLDGPAAALYSTALSLNETIPFQAAPLSKAARGYLLATDWHPAATDLPPEKLVESMTVNEAGTAIFKDCLARWMSNEAAALDGKDIEGMHKMRVGLRRLRSAFSLFRKALPSEAMDGLDAEAKWALQSMGAARDWDVIADDMLKRIESEREGDQDLAALRKAAERERSRAYAKAREAMLAPRYCSLVLRLGSWIEERAWAQGEAANQPLLDFARDTLKQRYKVVRRRGKGFDGLSAHDRHRLRIAIKKLRYSIDFFAGLYDSKPVGAYRRKLARLQDELGLLNDLAVMEGRFESLVADPAEMDPIGLSRATGKVVGWYAQMAAANRGKTVKRWKKLAKAETFWRR